MHLGLRTRPRTLLYFTRIHIRCVFQKFTEQELDLFTDSEKFLFIENSIRGMHVCLKLANSTTFNDGKLANGKVSTSGKLTNSTTFNDGKLANGTNFDNGKFANGKQQISRRSRGRSMEILCKEIKVQQEAAHWLNFPDNITGLYTIYKAVVRTC